MTKPFLYIDGDIDGSDVWWLPNNNDPIKDSGPRNMLPMKVACVSSGPVLQVSGSDIIELGDSAPPVAPSSGSLADSVIFRNVYGAEYTGAGASEEITNDFNDTRVQDGDLLGVGAWVYLDSSAAVDIQIKWVGFDSTGSITENSSWGTTNVEPDTWTYISHSDTVSQASTINASVSIEANGNQSVGDKIYVGALFLGIDPSEWTYPTTPPDSGIDFRFRAKILGDGTLFSNRTPLPAGTNGDSWHIEAINQGFSVRFGSRAGDDTLTTRTYTTPTNIYEYDKWYDFRWRADLDGTITFSILGNTAYGDWDVIDSGSVTALPDASFTTSRGIDTLPTGITAGNSNMILDGFGMFDPDNEIGWLETEEGASRIGSEVSFTHDGSQVDFNHSLYLENSGWIINADGANRGGLQLPNRTELKYGVGDYTIVQTFSAVASQDFRATYDDWVTNTGVKIRVDDSNNFGVLSGPESLTFTINPMDGTFTQMLVERESGVELRGYLNDFTTADASVADSGVDIDNTEPLNIGMDDTAVSSSYLSGLIGLTITFDRLLEDFEKDDLFFWIESGYQVESEPAWLRTEAVLYLNPNDPVQRAEYQARDRLINLAVAVPDEIYVRYDLTSSDGISNPVLTYNEVSFSTARQYLQQSRYGYDLGRVPLFGIGHGEQPLVVRRGSSIIPLEEMGADWLDSDWTINLWAKFAKSGVAKDVVSFGGPATTGISTTGTNLTYLYIDGNTVLVSNSDIEFEQYSMITVRRSGNSFEIFKNGVTDDTGTYSTPVTLTSDFTYSFPDEGVCGPLHIWHSALTDEDIASLYSLSTQSTTVTFNGTVSFTEGFSSQSINWERR